ncbi:hypothetical protein H7347_06855 [Corynebacterium sp. zg-331]|uniref:hypothetical protein n=1 Tax=unclassified Corynebacterium TaxID=2624378 RepID=UPI00128D1125|nr:MULTISPECIES: hypothetical protein [unclassified Corynebacterium]MBC3186291.1 hypothetical protein [Corynebacterium sp. zg-331]MPV52780.1 hypothetical protein [Corynebacterium sp. zg331]
MLEVLATDEHESLTIYRFPSTAIEIMEGALVVYRADQSGFLAGFAPGQWVRFRLATTTQDQGR